MVHFICNYTKVLITSYLVVRKGHRQKRNQMLYCARVHNLDFFPMWKAKQSFKVIEKRGKSILLLLPSLLLSFSFVSALSLVPKQQVPSNQITTPKRRRFATIFNATVRDTEKPNGLSLRQRPSKTGEQQREDVGAFFSVLRRW